MEHLDTGWVEYAQRQEVCRSSYVDASGNTSRCWTVTPVTVSYRLITDIGYDRNMFVHKQEVSYVGSGECPECKSVVQKKYYGPKWNGSPHKFLD